jgi:glutamate dehydrogenase
MLRPMMSASDIADLARRAKHDLLDVARLYYAVGAWFGFDRLRAAAGALASTDAFERMAVRRLIEDMFSEQRTIARAVLSGARRADLSSRDGVWSAVEAWSGEMGERAAAARHALEEIEASAGGWSFAKLTIVNAAIGTVAQAAED